MIKIKGKYARIWDFLRISTMLFKIRYPLHLVPIDHGNLYLAALFPVHGTFLCFFLGSHYSPCSRSVVGWGSWQTHTTVILQCFYRPVEDTVGPDEPAVRQWRPIVRIPVTVSAQLFWAPIYLEVDWKKHRRCPGRTRSLPPPRHNMFLRGAKSVRCGSAGNRTTMILSE